MPDAIFCPVAPRVQGTTTKICFKLNQSPANSAGNVGNLSALFRVAKWPAAVSPSESTAGTLVRGEI